MAMTKAEEKKWWELRREHLKRAEEVKERTQAMKKARSDLKVTRLGPDGQEIKEHGSFPRVESVPAPDPSEDPNAIELEIKIPEPLYEQLAGRARALEIPLGSLVAGMLREQVNEPFALPKISSYS